MCEEVVRDLPRRVHPNLHPENLNRRRGLCTAVHLCTPQASHSEDLYLSGTLTMASTYRRDSAIWKQ